MQEINCPSCQVRFRFRDEFTGKTIRCPKCANKFRLEFEPAAATLATTLSDSPGPDGEAIEQEMPRTVKTPVGVSGVSEQPEVPSTSGENETLATPEVETSDRSPKNKRKRKKKLPTWLLLLVVFVGLAAGVGGGAIWYFQQMPEPFQRSQGKSTYVPYQFNDGATNNTKVDMSALELEFQDAKGDTFRIQEFRGKKNVVLIFMRGLTENPGGVCAYCSTQTSRLIAQYNKFQERSTELLVVFPGSNKAVQMYLKDAKEKMEIPGEEKSKKMIPFPILLDPEFSAVNALKIRGDQAKPSTYILDKKGRVRFAYVGRTSVDRPSLEAIFRELDVINAEQGTTERTVTKPMPPTRQGS